MEPDYKKSICGTYKFADTNKNFELKRFRATEKTFIMYTIGKYDTRTGEHIQNYAYAVQPIIHVLDKRQFLICGQYQLPLFKNYPPNELRRELTQKPRSLVLSLQKQGVI